MNDAEMMDADLERARKYVDSVEWRYAKTLPQIPHCYAKRVWSPDEGEFEWFIGLTKRGVKEKFGKVAYWYLYLDGYKYWTGWADPKREILINRARIDGGKVETVLPKTR